jgi:HPt (histidine-containing phosphotransfer) domain-containing protein
MTDARDSAFAALLEAERAAYAGRLTLRVAEFEKYLEAGRVDDARRAAHKLSGSAGTYGFQSLSEVAREIEETLDQGRRVDALTLKRLREASADAGRSGEGRP